MGVQGQTHLPTLSHREQAVILQNAHCCPDPGPGHTEKCIGVQVFDMLFTYLCRVHTLDSIAKTTMTLGRRKKPPCCTTCELQIVSNSSCTLAEMAHVHVHAPTHARADCAGGSRSWRPGCTVHRSCLFGLAPTTSGKERWTKSSGRHTTQLLRPRQDYSVHKQTRVKSSDTDANTDGRTDGRVTPI